MERSCCWNSQPSSYQKGSFTPIRTSCC